MTKMALALGSFIVGAMFGSVFLGIHTSTAGHPLLPPQVVGIKGTDLREVIHMSPSAEAVVPPVKLLSVIRLTAIRSGQTLDGLNCQDCVFQDATVRYGGGSYNLTNAHFIGKTTFEVKGAAANTLAFIQWMLAVEANEKPRPVAPGKPLNQIATPKNAVIVNLVSPYTGK